MRPLLLILMLVCVQLCGCAGGAARDSDQARIQGVWLGVTESLNGHTKDVAFEYAFSGDTVTFTDETGKAMRYSFRLETTHTPKLITIWPEGTAAGSSPVSVAYVLDGDSLTLVIAPAGLRPTEISDRNDQELIVCKRGDDSGRR